MIKISKGLDLPITGKPSMLITDEPKISSVSLLGNDFVGMKPTMLVKENETVKAGQKLFEDKKNLGVFFTAPAGGIVKSINRGDKRKFLSCLIMIDEENVMKYAQDNDIPFSNFESLCKSEEVVNLIDGEVSKVNKKFASVEQVKKFSLIDIQLTAEDDELTPTMKLKRKFINQKYSNIIENMYQSA